MLERAEIAQARTAIVENLFAAFEEARKIAGQKLLQDGPADAVIEQSVVAAVERPHAAEKAGVVDGDHKSRKADSSNGRMVQRRAERAPAS